MALYKYVHNSAWPSPTLGDFTLGYLNFDVARTDRDKSSRCGRTSVLYDVALNGREHWELTLIHFL